MNRSISFVQFTNKQFNCATEILWKAKNRVEVTLSKSKLNIFRFKGHHALHYTWLKEAHTLYVCCHTCITKQQFRKYCFSLSVFPISAVSRHSTLLCCVTCVSRCHMHALKAVLSIHLSAYMHISVSLIKLIMPTWGVWYVNVEQLTPTTVQKSYSAQTHLRRAFSSLLPKHTCSVRYEIYLHLSSLACNIASFLNNAVFVYAFYHIGGMTQPSQYVRRLLPHTSRRRIHWHCSFDESILLGILCGALVHDLKP